MFRTVARIGVLALGLLGLASIQARAEVTTFTGVWDPTNPANGFSLASFYPWGCQESNPSVPGNCAENLNYTLGSMSLNSDHTVLTITFTDDPAGVGLDQTFANTSDVGVWASFALNTTPSDQPNVPISFDWSVSSTAYTCGAEFGIGGSDVGGGRSGCFGPGVFDTGHVTALGSSGLGFGAGFDSSGGSPEWIVTFSNFDADVPEPGTLPLLAAAIGGLGLLRRRSGRSSPPRA